MQHRSLTRFVRLWRLCICWGRCVAVSSACAGVCARVCVVRPWWVFGFLSPPLPSRACGWWWPQSYGWSVVNHG